MNDKVIPLRREHRGDDVGVRCACGETWLRLTAAPGASMGAVCPKCGETVTVRT